MLLISCIYTRVEQLKQDQENDGKISGEIPDSINPSAELGFMDGEVPILLPFAPKTVSIILGKSL